MIQNKQKFLDRAAYTIIVTFCLTVYVIFTVLLGLAFGGGWGFLIMPAFSVVLVLFFWAIERVC